MKIRLISTLILFAVFAEVLNAAYHTVEDNGENVKRNITPQYIRTEETAPSIKPVRKSITGYPKIFAEIQNYRLVENYLYHFMWIDRPLFHDSGLRKDGDSYAASFIRNAEILKPYGISGFTTIVTGRLIPFYIKGLKLMKKNKPYPNFSYLYNVASYGETEGDKEDFMKYYRLAASSPVTTRINGKIAVWSYLGRRSQIEAIKELRKRIKSENLPEGIFFVRPDFNFLFGEYIKTGKVSKPQIDKLRKHVTELLDAGCALSLDSPSELDAQGDYGSNAVVTGLYRNVIIPELMRFLKQEKYKNTHVGFYVSRGYPNVISGAIRNENGTQYFRQIMNEALIFNPDIMVLMEWNEANENTHFMPTVYNSFAWQRLLKYYARRLSGKTPEPNAGDDQTVPNMIFSSRQAYRLGDKLRYELLNVPDSDKPDTYKAQLRLKALDGTILCELPEETFKTQKLTAITYELPSENHAAQTIILPELTITNSAGKKMVFNLQYGRIHPSVCINYKEVYQPLRDLLETKASFKVEKNGKDNYVVAGSISCAEKLMQVEITDNEDEVWAEDREAVYQPENNLIIRGNINAFRTETSVRKVSFSVKDAPDWKWFRECYRNKSDGKDPQVIDNQVVVNNYYIDYYYPRSFYITIPRKSVNSARLLIEISGLGKYECQVSDLKKHGKLAWQYAGTTRIDLAVADNLVDIPVPLGRKSQDFKVNIRSAFRQPVFQLRAISESGKIYRSKPILPTISTGKVIEHNVFSSMQRKPVMVMVDSSRIPNLIYKFDPSGGAEILNSWEPFFDGMLGGGFLYLETFNRPNKILNISENTLVAPTWIKDSKGKNILKFDGLTNYIQLPREALPIGSFTLELEIKPEYAPNQVLLRSFAHHHGSLNLFLRKGKLEAVFTAMANGLFRPSKVNKFSTGLEVPNNKWSKIKVSYNYKYLTFSVNGNKTKIPFSERGYCFKPASIGGPVYPHYITDMQPEKIHATFFKGELRALSIRHNSEN